jgi:putative endopeptidase
MGGRSARHPPQANKPMYGDWGVDLTAGDKSVSPGADFDKYANGAWAARTKIPDDQARPGWATTSTTARRTSCAP